MMGKYTNLYADIYSIFDSAPWKNEGIPTFPSNFVGTVVGDTYCRVSILANSTTERINPPKSVFGQMIIDIFIPAGGGSQLLAQIADKLDKYLAGKIVNTTSGGSTQLRVSTLVDMGNDRDNPGLYRGQYSIPFNFFGI
jgi:hypothetical protein